MNGKIEFIASGDDFVVTVDNVTPENQAAFALEFLCQSIKRNYEPCGFSQLKDAIIVHLENEFKGY